MICLGILAPWERRKTKQDPVRARVKIQTRAPISALNWIAAGIMVAAALYGLVQFARGPAALRAVWECRDARLLHASDGKYLVATADGLSLLDGGRVVLEARARAEEALIIGDFVVFTEQGKVHWAGPGTTGTLPRSLMPGETLVPAKKANLILTCMPGGPVRYGQAWRLQAYGLDGNFRWECALQFPIFMALSIDGILIAAGTDLSAGGLSKLVALDATSGRLQWQLTLGSGLWRDIAAQDSATIIAGTADGLWSVDINAGSVRWTYQPGGSINAVAVLGTTVLAAVRTEPSRWLISPGSEVHAIDSLGVVIWRSHLGMRVNSLESTNSGALAVCGSDVIGFDSKSGRVLFRMRTGWEVADASGDLILLRRRESLRLAAWGADR